MTSTAIVAYLALFATVGFLFVLACLLLGRLLRAQVPTPLKLDIYECGEPAVGPGSVQFDLRFYVVALVFLIFEVEVALFFPPATVFGWATQSMAQTTGTEKGVGAVSAEKGGKTVSDETGKRDLGLASGKVALSPTSSHSLAIASMLDLGVFFAVLLVGFAYVWNRGDLDWVRAVHHPATPAETAVLRARLRGTLRS
jgi:NADH-quinone oxidoreductase subunit A